MVGADICIDNPGAFICVIGFVHFQMFKYVIINHNIFIYFYCPKVGLQNSCAVKLTLCDARPKRAVAHLKRAFAQHVVDTLA